MALAESTWTGTDARSSATSSHHSVVCRSVESDPTTSRGSITEAVSSEREPAVGAEDCVGDSSHHPGGLNDAVRRGIVTRNVAPVAHAPNRRSIPKVEPQAWTAQEVRAFLREAAGHRIFAALWLLAISGMRCSELLGLQWDDVDVDAAIISVNRGPVSIGYEPQESRGKTSNSRRAIDVDPTTVGILASWKRIVARAGAPKVRLHDVRHTHGTLLVKAGVPVKVVSERLGNGTRRSPSTPSNTGSSASRPKPPAPSKA